MELMVDCTKRTVRYYIIIALVAFTTGIIIGHFFKKNTVTKFDNKIKTIPLTQNVKPATNTKAIITAENANNKTQAWTIKHGDILAVFFHRAGLPSALWFDALKNPEATRYLEHL